jgi:hypothetical protein
LHKPLACIIFKALNPPQMKTAGLVLLLLLSLQLSAQSVFTNNTNSAIEKVIRDYPYQFKNIRGSLLLENRQTSNYQSIIQIPGALSCVISRSNLSDKEAMCWKAELFESDNFQEAKSRYKELYSQIRNSIVKIEGEKPYILNGQYEAPNEGKRFHSVVFSMLPAVGEMQKLKVELLLTQRGQLWKIGLVIYDQDRKNYEHALAAE